MVRKDLRLKIGSLVNIVWSRDPRTINKPMDCNTQLIGIIPAYEVPSDEDVALFYQLPPEHPDFHSVAKKALEQHRYVFKKVMGDNVIIPGNLTRICSLVKGPIDPLKGKKCCYEYQGSRIIPRCQRPARVEHNGDFYCGFHNPGKLPTKQQKRRKIKENIKSCITDRDTSRDMVFEYLLAHFKELNLPGWVVGSIKNFNLQQDRIKALEEEYNTTV